MSGASSSDSTWHWLPRDLVGPELAAGQLDLALQIAVTALPRDLAAARFAIGRIQLARGNADAAERSFWAALVGQPTARGIRGWIATTRLQRGDAQGALDVLRDEGEAPDDALAACARARAVAALGDLGRAADIVARALADAADDPGLRLLSARIAFDRAPDALPEALAIIDGVRLRHPALADAPMLQAQLLATAGYFDQADATLQASLGLATLAPELPLLLAELRLHRGDLDGVFALLPLLGAVCAGRAPSVRQLSVLMAALGDDAGAAMLAADADALGQAVDPTAGVQR